MKHWRFWKRTPLKPKIDIVEMTRRQLGAILPGIVNLEEISGDEKLKILASAKRVFEEKAFAHVLNALIKEQKDYLALHAREPEQYAMGRFTINGIALVQEEMERLRADYLEIISKEQDL